MVKVPAVQTSVKRQFAASAALKPQEREIIKPEPLKVSTMKNGLTVASIETHSPITTLGVLVKCGARNETYENSGVSHALRIAAGLATKKTSAFGLTRNLQQAGGSLTCLQGREHTLYAVQTTRDQTDIAVELLLDAVGNQAFKPWEVSRNAAPRMKLELAQKSPATEAMELLHQASFRSGLGNSLYSSSNRVGSHGPAVLQQFVSKHFTANRAVLLGLGVGHTALTKYSELLQLDSGSGPGAVASKFHAGAELRHETGGGVATVALATNCAGAVSVADCVAAMLLQRVLGMGSHVKWSNGQGKLAAAAAAATEGNHSVAALCQTYSDAGLLGAMIVCEAEAAGKVVGAVAAAIRSVNVTDEDVAAAKKNMTADVYSMLESPLCVAENIGSQVLLSGDVMPADKVPELIAGISTADVRAAAKKLSSASFSMGAVGNLSTVPHLDSL